MGEMVGLTETASYVEARFEERDGKRILTYKFQKRAARQI
jgi:hypothetical protein